jgi:hypothetical protein
VIRLAIAMSPALSQQYRAPRAANGQPDLQGIWQAETTASYDIPAHAASLGISLGAGVVLGGI